MDYLQQYKKIIFYFNPATQMSCSFKQRCPMSAHQCMFNLKRDYQMSYVTHQRCTTQERTR